MQRAAGEPDVVEPSFFDDYVSGLLVAEIRAVQDDVVEGIFVQKFCDVAMRCAGFWERGRF